MNLCQLHVGCLFTCMCSYQTQTHRAVHIFIKQQGVPRLSSPKIPGSSNVSWGPPWKMDFAVLLFIDCVLATRAPLRLSNVPWVSFFPVLGRSDFTVNNINTISTCAWGIVEGLVLDCYYSYLAVSTSTFRTHLASVSRLNTDERDRHLVSVTGIFPCNSINALHFSLNTQKQESRACS